MSHIEQAAEALLEARASGKPRGPVASEYALTDLASAYAVQNALISRQLQGERPAGYKLGLTDARARQALGVAEPLRGVLLTANEYQTGTTLQHADFIAPRLEIEVAMRLARDIEDPLADRADLIAALEGVMPALEVCDSAFEGWPKSLADAVADNLSFGAHVLGQCVAADSVQLDDLPVAPDNRRTGLLAVGHDPGFEFGSEATTFRWGFQYAWEGLDRCRLINRWALSGDQVL